MKFKKEVLYDKSKILSSNKIRIWYVPIEVLNETFSYKFHIIRSYIIHMSSLTFDLSMYLASSSGLMARVCT